MSSVMQEGFHQTSTYVQQESHCLGFPTEGSFVQGSAGLGLPVDVDAGLDQQPDGKPGQKERERERDMENEFRKEVGSEIRTARSE